MGKTNQPTRKQVRIITSWKFPLPPTKDECSLLISYILEGNGSRGDAVNERVRLSWQYFAKWVGALVKIKKGCRSRCRGQVGKVERLVALTPEGIKIKCRSASPHPYEAVVSVAGTTQQIAISQLKLLNQPTQPLLFELS